MMTLEFGIKWQIRPITGIAGFEQPTVVHELVEIEREKQLDALSWAMRQGWKDWGIWLDDGPALVFAADYEAAARGLADIPEVARLLDDGQVIRAPVRYRAQQRDPYPRIALTRGQHKIQQLRARYPTAEEDMAYVPQEVLIRRYGYPATIRSSAAAFT